MITKIMSAGLLLTATVGLAGEGFGERCPDLASCVKVVSKLTGDSYTHDGDLKAKIVTTENTELTSQNADLLFTHLLDLNGLARVPLAQPRSYTIMRQRDAKDTLLPKSTANSKFEPVLPNTWDWYDLVYELSHPEALPEVMSLVRNFLPANTRAVGSDVSGKVIVTGPIPVLRRIYGIIKDVDRALTPAQKKALEQRQQEKKAEKTDEVKSAR